MGHVILPSGRSMWIDELNGSVNLSHLAKDMMNNEYTSGYRVAIIAAAGKLGKDAGDIVEDLKKLAELKDGVPNKLVADAAEQAIKRIEEGGRVVSTRHPVTKTSDFTGSNYSSSNKKKEQVDPPQQVTFVELDAEKELYRGLDHYSRCKFCEKTVFVNDNIRRFSDALVGAENFHCPMCIRRDYWQRHNANIMILTYRGIFGYYYYSYYMFPKNGTTMGLSDIQEYVEMHVKIGLQNPLFTYDTETFNWFVDFNKIGTKKGKIPVEEVLKTITEQLLCFNIYENVRNSSPLALYNKYKSAVLEFVSKRVRMHGDNVFAPTLWGCGIPDRCQAGQKPIPVAALQYFTPATLADSNRTRK